jgi:DNA mismatch repair protein MutS
LFAPAPEPAATRHSAVEAALAALEPDTMSPRDALDALYQLKKLKDKS